MYSLLLVCMFQKCEINVKCETKWTLKKEIVAHYKALFGPFLKNFIKDSRTPSRMEHANI